MSGWRILENLPEKYRQKVVSQDSDAKILFGDMKKQKAVMKTTFPVCIVGKICSITCDVVESRLPLLLSKDSLKKAGLVLDMKTDTAVIFGSELALSTTRSGHYILPLRSNLRYQSTTNEKIALIVEETDKTIMANKTQLLKFHKQFGHCSVNSLSKLLKSANWKFDSDVLNHIVKNCEICKTTAKPARKPVTGLPLATDFNQVVSMDLHQLDKNLWYLHIICTFSRYSVAVSTKQKTAEAIMELFLRHWVSIFGPPSHAILTDNGGEFSNTVMHEFCERFNVKVMTTAAYSPFSNGICERHNAILTATLTKVRLEHKNLDLDTCLAYSCLAKNSIYNQFGFSPCQIVFGRNPTLPNLIDNKPPALETTEGISKTVRDTLSVIHKTREHYIQMESNDRLRRALRHNVSEQRSQFQPGDDVFYRRNGKWRGPGRIIGVDGKIFFVRMGGLIVRVHNTDLLAATESYVLAENESESGTSEKICKPAKATVANEVSDEDSSTQEAEEQPDISMSAEQQLNGVVTQEVIKPNCCDKLIK